MTLPEIIEDLHIRVRTLETAREELTNSLMKVAALVEVQQEEIKRLKRRGQTAGR